MAHTYLHQVSQISPTEFGSIITVIGGMLIGFYALVKFILANSDKNSQRDREERIALIKAIEDMAISNREIADKTDKLAEYAKEGNAQSEQRNGHLAELTIESKQATLEAISCIKVKQQVSEQHVDNQIVEHEIKE